MITKDFISDLFHLVNVNANFPIYLKKYHGYHLLFVALCLFVQTTELGAQCGPAPVDYPFRHGVASGDATQTHVVLWTRISALTPSDEINVRWMVATDSSMQDIVAEGQIITSSALDFTVKADAGPLEPGQWYYYAFEAMETRSMTGRTRTLPDSADRFDFAAFSCSNYEAGYFNAYRDALINDHVQAIVHVGDYYYEYSIGEQIAGRLHDPSYTLYSLSDYRRRHAQICTDRDLAELRRQFPWYTIWDDHEFANDSYTGGALSHDTSICTWETRREAARRAYFEWMPIRENVGNTVERHHSIPNLVSLNFLDTRVKDRSAQVSSSSPLIGDSLRTIIGNAQFDTLLSHLREDDLLPWKLIFTSVMMTKAVDSAGLPVDADLWEGYRYERRRLWDSLQVNQVHGVISIAGDYHTSWAGDLPLADYNSENQTGSLGNEFTVCAATSSPHSVGDIATFMSYNPHVKWIEQEHNGYMLCSITPDSLMAHWRYTATNLSRNDNAFDGKTAVVYAGSPFVIITDSVPEYINNTAPQVFAGAYLMSDLNPASLTDHLVVFPNPARNSCHIQWKGPCGLLRWRIFSVSGQLIDEGERMENYSGDHDNLISLAHLAPGFYLINLRMGADEVTRKIIVAGQQD